MELKSAYQFQSLVAVHGSNRTFMELKLFASIFMPDVDDGSNRTFMELKW